MARERPVAHWYRTSGLLVASEVDLLGLIPASESTSPDVTIRRRAVPAVLEGATAKGPTWEIAADSFLLRIDGIARFLLTGGREIAFEIEAGASPDDAAIFLTGTVFGILLHQRGQIVLHASAVRVGGKAVLFCGSSGAGKSTIAAALGQHGYPLLNDDVCALSPVGGSALVAHPDGRKLKLWANAIKELDLAARRGSPVRVKLGKFYVEPAHALSESLPVGALYVLREGRPPNTPGIERPNVVDAALVLQQNAYRPSLVKHMGQKANYFHAATTMAGAAGIFRLTRNFNFTEMPDVIAWLEQHWRETGLLDTAA
jgi:hypothetical protein